MRLPLNPALKVHESQGGEVPSYLQALQMGQESQGGRSTPGTDTEVNLGGGSLRETPRLTFGDSEGEHGSRAPSTSTGKRGMTPVDWRKGSGKGLSNIEIVLIPCLQGLPAPGWQLCFPRMVMVQMQAELPPPLPLPSL